MKMKWICLLLLGAGSAWAAPVTYNFTGRVSQIQSQYGTTITDTTYSLGQTITASITYDLSTGEVFPFPPEYTNVLQSLWVDNGTEMIGRTALNVDYQSQFYVHNDNSGTDGIEFLMKNNAPSSYLTGSSFNGKPLDSIELGFSTFNTNLYADSSLPSSINPSDFEIKALTITYQDPSPGGEVYHINAYQQVVPEPATIGLLGLFGAGLFAVRRIFRIGVSPSLD